MFVHLLGINPLLSGVTTDMNSNLEQCIKATLSTTGLQLYLLYHLASFLLFVVTGQFLTVCGHSCKHVNCAIFYSMPVT